MFKCSISSNQSREDTPINKSNAYTFYLSHKCDFNISLVITVGGPLAARKVKTHKYYFT